jgi:hypothetical protein
MNAMREWLQEVMVPCLLKDMEDEDSWGEVEGIVCERQEVEEECMLRLQLHDDTTLNGAEKDPKIDPRRVLHMLDIACGSGEATRTFHQALLDCKSSSVMSTSLQTQITSQFDLLQVQACDPYTSDAFNTLNQLPTSCCQPYSFTDISNGIYNNQKFHIAFCSFALHLCPTSLLPAFMIELARCCRYFVIISPHKKPLLPNGEGLRQWGWERVGVPVVDGDGEEKEEWVRYRIHFRMFRSLFFVES